MAFLAWLKQKAFPLHDTEQRFPDVHCTSRTPYACTMRIYVVRHKHRKVVRLRTFQSCEFHYYDIPEDKIETLIDHLRNAQPTISS